MRFIPRWSAVRGWSLMLIGAMLLIQCASPNASRPPVPSPASPSTSVSPSASNAAADADAEAFMDVFQSRVMALAAMEESTGVFDDRILFGQSAAFSGPAQELGKNAKVGIEAAFHEVNQRGGVHGRRLELLSLDDIYEPDIAISNTFQLIEREEIFALIGAVGTATSRSTLPIAATAGVPYIAPFTGASFLREGKWGNVLNLRASINQEVEEIVARLTDDLGLERIAVLYQNDSLGDAGHQATMRALMRRGTHPVAHGVYPRNTTAVKTAIIDIRRSNPEAVILIGSYEPIAAVIHWARFLEMDLVFVTLSFVGGNALVNELGEMGTGVYVSQVVPFPMDDSIPVILDYRNALAAYSPETEPGFFSLEGYLAGRLAILALERCGQEVVRSCVVNSMTGTGEIDLDGFDLHFGDFDNQGSDAVYLTVIGDDGAYHPVETMQVADP